MTLVSHIEQTLGQLDHGWSFRENSSSVQVVRFRNQPFDGAVTYVTLGLSNVPLAMPQGVKVNGWNQFEDVLEHEDPDLWELNRASIVVK